MTPDLLRESRALSDRIADIKGRLDEIDRNVAARALAAGRGYTSKSGTANQIKAVRIVLDAVAALLSRADRRGGRTRLAAEAAIAILSAPEPKPKS